MFCAALTAVALAAAPIACTKDEPAKTDAASADAGDKSDPKDAGDGDKSGDDGAGGGLAAKAKAAVEVISGPRDIEPSYPAELDALLDLVPADAESFVVVRDVGSLVHGTLAYAKAQKSSMQALADEMAKSEPADADGLREALKVFDELGTKLEASGIDLSAGAVIANGKGEDDSLLVYGSAKADALPGMLLALGAKSDEVPQDCAVVASAAGYSVCAKAGAAAYAPGKKAKDLRARVLAKMPGADLERANVVALFVDDGAEIPVLMETGQGMMHVALAVPDARDELGKVLQAGKATSLGVIGAGQPFVWAQLSPALLATQSSSAPPMAQPLVKSLTGEVVFGGVAGTRGFLAGVGVSDPAPATGMISLASLGLSEVPKSLPDGTKLDVAIETIEAAGAKVSAIHGKLGAGKHADLLGKMGYTAEAFAFAAGKLAVVAFGSGQDVIESVASAGEKGPSKELLSALPTPLSRALDEGKAAAAIYSPFDALQAGDSVAMLESLADQIQRDDLGKTDPKVAMRLMVDVMAPLSSASAWITDLDQGPVVHVALQGFGVVGTEEGDAAFEALGSIGGGADRKASYSALAKKYSGSARSASYRARAGELGDPVGSLLILATVAGGLGALFFLGRMDSAMAVPPSAVAVPPAVAVPEVAPPAPPAPPAPQAPPE
jgi:hypothetical protein